MTNQTFLVLLILTIISYLSVGIAAAALAYLHYIQHPRAYKSKKFNQDVAGFYVFFWPVTVILFLLYMARYYFLPRFILAVARFGKAYFEFIDKLKGKIS